MSKKFPSEEQDRFIVRMPEGMRERIKRSAERSGRSMNAEIVKALELAFPPEPSIEELIEKVHGAIQRSQQTRMPYREVLIDALDSLLDTVSSGLETDQFVQRLPPDTSMDFGSVVARIKRWQRAEKYGVEQDDLVRELGKGLLRHKGGDVTLNSIKLFRRGEPRRALLAYGLDNVKFREPEAAHAAMLADLEAYYRDNWGDPDEMPPWQGED